ncbi:MAG: DUF4149 domain-containing protein [Methylotenera sp.]|nr:DUF4149 domain-containing protein [Methylotenera sp.]MSP99612.1 DUF4149 domain-containing protein [Methylotenera sp.]
MKNNWSDKLSLIVITLWVGALWAIGAVAYVLFNTLADAQLAGQLAGKFFNELSYLGLFSAFFLLLQRLFAYGTSALKQSYFWAVLLMLLLVLAGHFGIQPILAQLKADALPSDVMQSVFSDRFKTWHGVASIAYVVQCLLGFVVVLKK